MRPLQCVKRGNGGAAEVCIAAACDHCALLVFPQLNEIDSAGDGGNDLLELVADFRAGLQTQRMLLDDFMQGFLFALVRQKWSQYTRYAFYGMRAVELCYLVALTSLSFLLKMEPSSRSIVLALFTLVFGLLLFSLEVLLMVLWWRNDVIRAFESLAGMQKKLQGLSLWARAFSWRAKLVGFACATAATSYYLYTANDVRSSRADAPMYLLLGISSYVQGKGFIAAACVSPYMQKMGVQMIIIEKMFQNDVMTYLVFLVEFTINYFLAMYIALPLNADSATPAENLLNGRYVRFDMEKPLTGLNAMFEQAVIGIRFTPNFAAQEVDDFSLGEWLCFLFFYAIHLTFCVVCIILLVRLLMAMMTNTFRTVQEQAQLEWRLLITRHVLRLEVIGDLLHGSRRLLAGTLSAVDGKYYHHFLDVHPAAGESKTVPMQLAQAGEHDPLFEDESPAKRRPAQPTPQPTGAGFLCNSSEQTAPEQTAPPSGGVGESGNGVPESSPGWEDRREGGGEERLRELATEVALMRSEMAARSKEQAVAIQQSQIRSDDLRKQLAQVTALLEARMFSA